MKTKLKIVKIDADWFVVNEDNVVVWAQSFKQEEQAMHCMLWLRRKNVLSSKNG